MSDERKNVLILCRRDEREAYDQRATMLGNLPKDSRANYTGADFEDLVFAFDGKTMRIIDSVSGVDIKDHDAIFLIGWFKSKTLDDIARAVAHYARAHNVPFSNSEAYNGRSFTKLSQCVIAALNGLTVTPFVFVMDQELLLKEVTKGAISFPYVAKAVSASRGQDNYLINDHDELKDAIDESKDAEPPKYFIVQEFVPNDGDYRVLVAGGEVRLVIHRKAQGDSHLNNTSQGGTATLVAVDSLPQEVREQSVRMAKLLGRELTGVDMMMHRETGVFYFLEANNMPQLSTGSFVPEKMKMLDEYLLRLTEVKP